MGAAKLLLCAEHSELCCFFFVFINWFNISEKIWERLFGDSKSVMRIRHRHFGADVVSELQGKLKITLNPLFIDVNDQQFS